MIQGLRTVIYPAPDLAAGKAWYSQVLASRPISTSFFTWASISAASNWV